MKNLIFILLLAFACFLALYFYRQYDVIRTDLALANQRILDRDRLIYNHQKQLEVLKNKTPATPVTAPTQTPTTGNSTLGTVNAGDLARLQKSGLTNPEADLRNDLLNKQDILLPKGALGGNMTIRDVKILSNRYALAYFEDGHSGGYMLLRFSVEQNNRIAWKVLDYYVM